QGTDDRGDASRPAHLHDLAGEAEGGMVGGLELDVVALELSGCVHRSPSNVAITASISSGLIMTSRALEPSLGPTIPRLSRMSISRPALAKPTRNLRCSIDVEPNWVETTSSTAWITRSRSSPMSSSSSRLEAA